MSIIWGFELDPSLNPLLNPELPMEFDTIHRIWTYFNCSLNYRQKQQKELNIRANDVLMMASVKLFNTNVKHRCVACKCTWNVLKKKWWKLLALTYKTLLLHE